MSAIPDTSWDTLYIEFQPKIYNYFQRRMKDVDLIEDFVSETFIKAIDATKQGNGAQTHFAGWLYRIAHNLVIDYYRTKERRRFVSFDDIWEVPVDDDLEVRTELVLELEEVRATFSRLSEAQREVVLMYAWEEQSFEEIGEAMGKNAGSVKSLLYRARFAMNAMLGKEQPTNDATEQREKMAAILRECGPMVKAELIEKSKLTENKVYSALYCHPEVFCRVGAISRGKLLIYKWGLVGVHDKEAA